jgi:hypothetical protein
MLSRSHFNEQAGHGGAHLESQVHGRLRHKDHSLRTAQEKAQDSIQKITKGNKGWRCGSSGIAPA